MRNREDSQLIRSQLVDLASDLPEIYEAARRWFIQQGPEITTDLVQGLDDDRLGSIGHWRILLLLRYFTKEETLSVLLKVLQRSLQRNDFLVLSGAMEALAVFQNPEAVKALIALLQERDSDVVKHAAVLLGQIGDTKASEPLIHLLTSSDPSIRYSAAKALILLGGSANLAALKRHLENETDVDTRKLMLGE